MNEIPELKDDILFLKEADFDNKIWKEAGVSGSRTKTKKRSNFTAHPKRFSSESECSSNATTPRKFFSESTLKNLNLHEPERNDEEKEHLQPKQCFHLENQESGKGDSVKPPVSHTKDIVTSTRKPMKKDSYPFKICDKKFKNLVERSLAILTKIRRTIEDGIPPPDGEEDYFRRLKRMQEFSTRFSRIYLYPLMRQMDELSLPEKLALPVIDQKFLYAQQVILQGLQAFHSHLSSSIGKCASDKLRALLDQIMYMCHLFELLKKEDNQDNIEFISALRTHVELLLETLTTFDLKFVEKGKPKSENSIQKKVKSEQSKTHLTKTKSKLSMYRHNTLSKKAQEQKKYLLATKKYNVKSKYKTSGFKHRPPIEKKSVPDTNNKLKFGSKVLSRVSDSSHSKTPIREDDIKTMVEMDSSPEAPPNTTENMHYETNIPPTENQKTEELQQKLGSNSEDIVEKLVELLGTFLPNTPDNKQVVVLEQIASELVKKKEDIQVKKKQKEPVITVTGAKNAKLICIRDYNSAEEDCADESNNEVNVSLEAKQPLNIKQAHNKPKKEKNKAGIKISRLPKNKRRLLTLLPKAEAINVIQYKLRYHHFHKHNPMYRKSAHVQPWVLMGRVSDSIFEDVLRSVARELEVNEVLENLYNAEFKY